MAINPPEVLPLTVTVVATEDTVTVTAGDVLTDSNCVAGALVAIGGQSGFVKARLSTTTFQLSRPWWGASASGVNCDIAPYTPEMASRVALSQQLATYNADLVLFEAYRRGFVNFFSTSVDLSDPGTGHAGLNSLTPADATAMVVSDADATGQSQSARFQELSRGDRLTLRTVDTEAFAAYTLTVAPTAETGFTKILGLTYVEGSGTFSADAKFTIEVTNIAEGLEFDAQVANIAARADHDSEAAGYRVLVDDTGAGRAGVYTLVTPGGSAVWAGPAYIDGQQGDQGEKGWSPRHALVVDGARKIFQLAGYVGGAGDVPTADVGKYVGATGYEADIANGIDVQGIQGPSGDGLYNKLPEVAKTSDYTVITADAGNLLTFDKATSVTATLPAVAASDSQVYRFLNIGAGDLTIDPNASELVDGASTLVLPTGSAADVWPNVGKTSWRAFTYSPAGDYLNKANNLSDLASPLVARTNLGLAWEVIYDEQRASVASLDFINLSAYRRLRGKIFVRPSAAAAISFRVSDNNGSSFYAGASDYENAYIYGIGGATAHQDDTAVAQIRVSITGAVGSGAQEGATIEFELDRFNESGTYTWLTYRTTAYTSTPQLSVGQGGGLSKVTGVFDAFQIFPSTGTVTHAVVFLEGLR